MRLLIVFPAHISPASLQSAETDTHRLVSLGTSTSAGGLVIALPHGGGWGMGRDNLGGPHLPPLRARWAQCDFRGRERVNHPAGCTRLQRGKLVEAFLSRLRRTQGKAPTGSGIQPLATSFRGWPVFTRKPVGLQ